jgi:urease accessory protein
MIRVVRILPSNTWDRTSEADQALIDFDHRHCRRIVLTAVAGTEVLVDQPQAIRLSDGDGLLLDCGGIVRVQAKPESLMQIHTHGEGELVRIAWHLGNRHLPVQLLGECIRIRADHGIGDMVEKLGAHVELIEAPFDPEAGAYAGAHHHHHDDDSDHHH